MKTFSWSNNSCILLFGLYTASATIDFDVTVTCVFMNGILISKINLSKM